MALAKKNKNGQIVLSKTVEKRRHQQRNHLIEIDYKADAEKVLATWGQNIERCFGQYEVPEYKQYKELPKADKLFGTYSQFYIDIIDYRIYQYKSQIKKSNSLKYKINKKRSELLDLFLQGTDDDFYYENVFKPLVLYLEEETGSKLKELTESVKRYEEKIPALIQLRKIYEEKSKTDNVILTPQEFEIVRKKESAKEI